MEMSSGFNATIREEFTVPFGRVLPPHKQADNHREADFQLDFLRHTDQGVYMSSLSFGMSLPSWYISCQMRKFGNKTFYYEEILLLSKVISTSPFTIELR